MNIASRKHRAVPFSFFYHHMLRDVIATVEAEYDREAGHDYSHRVTNAIVLAAFATEATANEIGYWLQVHHTQPVAVTGKFEDYRIREKWQFLAHCHGAPGFVETGQPWVDFATFVDLRNALVHPGAYTDPSTKLLRVLDRLDSLGCTRPGADWLESAMTVRTARWVRDTILAMPEALRQMLAPRLDLHNEGFSWVWEPDRLSAM
jgi:hypothetical protein